MPELRSGKDFRAYTLSPGQPIEGPISFDLEIALDLAEQERQSRLESDGYDSEDDVELQSELSDISDLTDLDELEEAMAASTVPPSSFHWRDYIPSFLHHFLPRPRTEEVDEAASDDEDANADDDPSTRTPAENKRLRRKRKSSRNKGKRRVKRKTQQELLKTKLKEISRRRAAESKTMNTPEGFASEELPVNSGGWSGLRKSLDRIIPQMEELCGEDYDMQVVDWNGQDSFAIVDRNGRIISVLAGKPHDENWDALMEELALELAKARRNMSFSEKQKKGKRGEHPSVPVGTSFGGGSKRPGTLAFYGKSNKRQLLTLMAHRGFQRLVGFTNCVFEAFAANTFGLYRENLDALFQSDSRLVNWFKNSVFAACSFNLGPETVTFPHTDSGNLAYGWCAITALGNFNPDLGGHLVLWDLGLIIRFPPGSTILIPSALLTHSNVPIQKGETRYSVVQYSASGLFRWMYNGCMSDKDFLAHATPTQKEKRAADAKARWGNGYSMFSLWNDVCKARSSQ